MESKKNKKSPKKGRKKALSPSKQTISLKLSPKLSSPKPNNIIELSNKNINNNKSKSPKNEKIEEKIEEKSDPKKKSEENMIFDFPEEENLSQLYLNELSPFFRPKGDETESPTGDRITNSLKKMEKGDDMDILNELVQLREFLSIANERIGFNPNIAKLLEEICKNLTKTYLPEMIIYCLQCINYIIDINPSLVTILKKINAISSIMNTIASVEDISCVEHIIKIFEKISLQNSRILLENNIFESFLVNVFDFLNIYQKKTIMKICYNMANRRFSIQDYNSYIKPAMNVLINLINLDDNDERENLFIVESATNIFYCIINHLKYEIMYDIDEKKEKDDKNDIKEKDEKKENNINNENIVDEIIKNYSVIENFKLILDKYFLKNSKIITETLIQNILKTLVLILEISNEGMNKILSNKFLDIIGETVQFEFLSEQKGNNNNNSINNNTINIIPRISSNALAHKKFSVFAYEFFDILNSFFPSEKNNYYKGKNNNDKKILKPENKIYYDYFCQNIFLPLINNVMKKPITTILSNNFIRLISSFINNATKEDIIFLLPSKPISQIIIKLLNTRKSNLVNDSIFLIKSLLDKSPENYIVSFVREGIIDNLKNFKPLEEEKIERRREGDRLIIPKYDLNILSKDYKLYKRDRDLIRRRREDLFLKLKKLDKDSELNKLIPEQKDNNNNIKIDDKNKNNEIPKETNEILIENNNIKEKKEKTEIKLDEDKEAQEQEQEQENIQLDNQDNENPEENEENEEENEDNEDNDNIEEENNENEEEIEEEQEEEEEQEMENSEKIEENNNKPEEKMNINENVLEEENDIIKEDLIQLNKNIELFPKKEKEIINEIKQELDKEKEKEKEKEIKKDDNNINNNKEIKELPNKEEKNDIIEEKDFYLVKSFEEKIERLNKKIDLEKELLKDTLLLSRKRKFDFDEKIIHRKRRYHLNDSPKKISDNKIIQDKIKELLDNYLTEEKIQQYLSLDENKEKINLIKIKETLSNYNKEIFSLTTSFESKEICIKNALDILTNENISITLYELDSSKILLSLCHFFGAEFFSIYNQLKDDSDYKNIDALVNDLKERKIIPEKKEINYNIYQRLSKFFNFFGEGDKVKILKFITLLNESILGMNNTILNLYDKRSHLYYMPDFANINLHMSYNEEIFKEKVLKDNYITDENFKTKLCELNMFFFTNKRLILSLNNTTTFKTMGITLLSTANIPLISNDKYDIAFEFYVEIKKEKIEEKEKKDLKELKEDKDNKIENKMEIEKEKEKEIVNFEDEEINIFNNNENENDEIMEEIEEEEINIINLNKIEEVKNTSNIKNKNEKQKQELNDINNKEINNNNKEITKEKKYDIEIYNIKENTTYREFIQDFTQKYKETKPYIKFGLSLKPKKSDNINLNQDNTNNNIIIEIEKEEKQEFNYQKYFSSYIKDNNNNTINRDELINFNEYSLIKEYHENILYNKHLYFSKSLSPSLYLLSLMNLALIKFPKLFNFPKANKDLQKLFYNMKLDLFIFKTTSIPKKIINGSYPYLANYISNNRNYNLTKFQTRLLSFKTSFNPQYKSMINLQNYLKHNNPEIASKISITIKKNMRLKINVEREKIIEHVFNIINDSNFSDFIGYLEFEYKGEIGNGLGPTLEFYTLISDKIRADKNLWYKTTDGSLYPKLIEDENNSNNSYNIKMFKLLGYIVGRAIFDDRLLDIPLNKIFWDRVLERGVVFESLKYIDENLYKTISDFFELIKQKNDYIKNNNINKDKLKEINFDEIILYNKCKLSELDIYFTFPGYDINLKPNGDNILLTMNNIEEYINLIYDFIFFKGVNALFDSFKEGFNMNFDINKMQCFTSEEIEEHICGSKEIKWEKNNLYENLNPEHGYTKQSKIFNDLIQFMCNLNDAQKKKFLIFSTGSSRLPIGGFKSLSPKLTVVKKYCEEGSNPNDFLPTVMTCQNYLKIPEYTRYDILEKKILLAMEEGCNEFSLS